MIQQAKAHVDLAEKERRFYKEQCRTSKEALERDFVRADGSVDVPPIDVPPCSRNTTLHISFDFAQQVHYPSNPLQPGPIYFLTPRKCGIFGVCREGIQLQVKI